MTASPVRTALRDRLVTAMRARDTSTVSALRTAIAALENAEAVPSPMDPSGSGPGAGPATSRHIAGAVLGAGASEVDRLVLDEATEAAILRTEVESLLEAAVEYEARGRDDAAARARTAAHELSTVVHSALGTTWG